MLLLIILISLSSPGHSAGICVQEVQRADVVRERIEQEWPLRPNDEVTQFVRRFGQELGVRSATKSNWQVTVVRDYGANAYSIGNGYIYITEGSLLLVDSDSELAAIIAHEMGHNLAGHFCPRTAEKGWLDRLFGWMLPRFGEGQTDPQTTAAKGSLGQGWDPVKELEANALARQLLAAGGYDPYAIDRVARKLENGLHEGIPTNPARPVSGPAKGIGSNSRGGAKTGEAGLARIQKILRSD